MEQRTKLKVIYGVVDNIMTPLEERDSCTSHATQQQKLWEKGNLFTVSMNRENQRYERSISRMAEVTQG
jgi:hypothetical protein